MIKHDPLRVLRSYDPVVAPRPAFTARLRQRLESALTSASGLPRPAALPYLIVADARIAIDWYIERLGASLIGTLIIMNDNRIGHAELALADGVLYLAEEFPELGLSAPKPGSTSVSLMLAVADTDRTVQRVRESGAHLERGPEDDHGSRTATIIDPFGHRWILSGPL